MYDCPQKITEFFLFQTSDIRKIHVYDSLVMNRLPLEILEYIQITLIKQYEFEAFVKLSCTSKIFNIFEINKVIAKTKMDWRNQLLNTKHILMFPRYKASPDLANVISELEILKNKVFSATNKTELVLDYLDVIIDIKDEINMLFRRQDITVDYQKQILMLRDQLFSIRCFGDQNNLQHMYDVATQSINITKIFNEFLKGITYFASELPYSPREPVYHRHGSCPPRGNANFSCNSARGTVQDKQSLEKCFIERLVCDLLWSELTGSQQDTPHIEWLAKTKEAWTTCFPKKSLQVKLEFNERTLNNNNTSIKDRVPIELVVTMQGEGYDCIDTYIRSWRKERKMYADEVFCQRVYNGVVHTKTCTFNDSDAWTQQLSGGKTHKRAWKSRRITYYDSPLIQK